MIHWNPSGKLKSTISGSCSLLCFSSAIFLVCNSPNSFFQENRKFSELQENKIKTWELIENKFLNHNFYMHQSLDDRLNHTTKNWGWDKKKTRMMINRLFTTIWYIISFFCDGTVESNVSIIYMLSEKINLGIKLRNLVLKRNNDVFEDSR